MAFKPAEMMLINSLSILMSSSSGDKTSVWDVVDEGRYGVTSAGRSQSTGSSCGGIVSASLLTVVGVDDNTGEDSPAAASRAGGDGVDVPRSLNTTLLLSILTTSSENSESKQIVGFDSRSRSHWSMFDAERSLLASANRRRSSESSHIC